LLKPPDGPCDGDSVATPLTESPFKGKTGLVRVFNAFLNSLDGLRDAWRHESAFRQEVLIAAILIPIACYVPMSGLERAALIGSPLLVIMVELLNSSVEAAIDRISLDRHALSKRAKDLGSAAVFVALVLMGLAWGLVLPQHLP
jgi:diacylglycerol kinase (ATP)